MSKRRDSIDDVFMMVKLQKQISEKRDKNNRLANKQQGIEARKNAKMQARNSEIADESANQVETSEKSIFLNKLKCHNARVDADANDEIRWETYQRAIGRISIADEQELY